MTAAPNIRMSPVDRAWLAMERRTNPMMVVALLILTRPLPLARFRSLMVERFLTHARFRWRPVNETLTAHWVDDPSFDIEAHVHLLALPKPGEQTQLEALVAELASTPLPADRPLWSFHLVENYRGGCAVVVRIHHCYADGIALVRVMLGLMDQTTPLPEPNNAHAADSWWQGLDSWYQPLSGLIERGVHLALHPAEAAGAARDVASLAQEFAHIALLPADNPTRLKAPLSGAKRVAWGAPLALDEVRTVARVLGCTINDIVMSTLSGALGAWLRRYQHVAERDRVRAAVPVNLRPPDVSTESLGNQFGLVFVDLPIGLRNPVRRVYEAHDSMAALRGSKQPAVAYGLLAALGNLPAALEEPAIELFSEKASLVVSNVPGPRQSLSMGGAPIEQILFWVPQSGSIGIGVSILTYANTLQFGVIADRNLLAEPDELTALFAVEFERLLLLSVMALTPG